MTLAILMTWLASVGVGACVYFVVWCVLDCIEDVRWNREHGI